MMIVATAEGKHCFFWSKTAFVSLSLFFFIVQNTTALEEENALLKEKIRSLEESSVSFD